MHVARHVNAVDGADNAELHERADGGILGGKVFSVTSSGYTAHRLGTSDLGLIFAPGVRVRPDLSTTDTDRNAQRPRCRTREKLVNTMKKLLIASAVVETLSDWRC